MTSSLETVTDITFKLREQKSLPLWAVADSGTILAIAKGEDVVYGPRGRWVNAMFKVVGLSWLGVLTLRAIAAGCVTLWWMKSLAVATTDVQVKELFIGFGAGPEAEMFKRFQAESDRSVQHLDQTKPASLAIIARPPLAKLWCLSWSESRRVVSGFRHTSCLYLKNHVTQWLSATGIKIGTYVFFRAWAECLPRIIDRVIFLSPDTPAFAIIDSEKYNPERAVEFWQHGLLRQSLILPKFHKVLALNRPEAAHISKFNPSAEIRVSPVDLKRESVTAEPLLLMTSLYTSPEFDKYDHLDLLAELFSWAKEKNIKVVVRPHPCEDLGFWGECFPQIFIDHNGGSFSECLSRWSPGIVISWFSTTLMDALKGGVLPVLITHGSEKALADIVFPLDRIAIKWPEEQALLEHLLEDQGLYRDQLRCRQQEAFGALRDND